MEITFNKHSMRAQSSRYKGLFSGKRIVFWRLLILIAIAVGVTGWLGDVLYMKYIGLGVGLLLLQLYLWWLLYLKELTVEKSNEGAIELDKIADAELLRRIRSNQSPLELWRSLEGSWQRGFIMNRLFLDSNRVEQSLGNRQEDSKFIWAEALSYMRQMNLSELTIGCLVPALVISIEDSEQWLAENKLTSEDVVDAAHWQVRVEKIMKKLQQKRSFGGVARDWAAGYTPLINRFAHDLSGAVEHGAYEHLYLQTHSEQLEQMLQSLQQPNNNTVALIGGTGSGKTSLAFALAERLLDPRNTKLQYHKVFALDASLIVAEAKRAGNLESLLLHIVAEARRAGNIILFFDDAHSFFSNESGAVDMSNVLLQILRSGRVRMLFAFRPADWQYLDSVASDVTAQVNQLVVQEPDRGTVEKVLQDQALSIEAETGSTISYLAIKESYDLADRYITEQVFPGKAINLLRTAAGNVGGGWVDREAVQKTVENMLGVKVASATPEESSTLLHLEDQLHKYMINQSYAVGVVADALRRARAGVRTNTRPVGSFLFLGPTGVGKTELTKALARVYYGGEEKIIRVDMSEYSQPGSVDRLIATSANAGSFLGRVRQAPFSVVLLDEVEKSSSEVQNLLLQMLDEGSLTDEDGRSVSFKDAIVITTSNAGADIIRSNIEQGKDLEDFSESFVDQLIDSQQFRPELMNRFDEVVLFRPLNKQELREVVTLLLGEVNANLQSQRISVTLSDAAIDYIVDEGYDPRLGARPMRRMMQRTVENVVAKRVLEGSIEPGSSAELDVSDIS